MSYLNTDILYGTINPTNQNSEFISFTGITQNSNGTALLTGVTRGLGRSFPYTASTTLARSVPGQTSFILSSPPEFFNEYATKRNAQSITGLWTYSSTSAPKYDYNPDFLSQPSTTLASIGFVASTSYAGTVDANDSTKGIVEMATQAEAAAGTSLGSTAARLALGANIATSTPTASCAFCVVVATAGKIAQAFIDLTQAFTFTNLVTVTGGFTSTGTTTVSAANLLTNPFVLNTIAYVFPSTRGASSTVLTENGSGTLRWITPQATVLYTSGAIVSTSDTSATTTWVTIPLPVGTLTTASSIEIQAFPTGTDGGSGSSLYDIQFGTGSATTTLATDTAEGTTFVTTFLNLQSTSVETFATSKNGAVSLGTAAHSNAAQLYISFRSRAGNAADTTGFRGMVVKLNRY